MSDGNYTFDINTENFEQYVIQNSEHVPVAVDFWALWCGPCKSLMPILSKLADEYNGQFLLAKVNIDEQQELAMQFGVRSVPTVKLIRHGQVVGEFTGAQPESRIRQFLDEHIEWESDRQLPEIIGQFNGGEHEAALQRLQQWRELEPDNLKLLEMELQWLVNIGRFQQAQEQLQSLPANIHQEPTIQAIESSLKLQLSLADAPKEEELRQRLSSNPDDSEALYQLALQLAAADNYETALETFLELLRRDRDYGDDAARKGMLMLFEQLGPGDERVARYRRQMFTVLH